MKKKEIKEKLKVEDDTENKIKSYLNTKKGKKTKLFLVLGCTLIILGFIISLVKVVLEYNSISLDSLDIIFIIGDWIYNFGFSSFILFFLLYFIDVLGSKDVNEKHKNDLDKIDNITNLLSRLLLISLFEFCVTSSEESTLLTQLSGDILCSITSLFLALLVIKLLYLVVANYDENKKNKKSK